MTQEQLLIDAGAVLANVTFFVSLLFPVVTAFYWRWWDSAWGRNIVSLELGIAVTLLPAVLFRDFGIDSLALRWVQVTALATVPLIVAWRVVMIWLAQRSGALHGRRLRRAGVGVDGRDDHGRLPRRPARPADDVAADAQPAAHGVPRLP